MHHVIFSQVLDRNHAAQSSIKHDMLFSTTNLVGEFPTRSFSHDWGIIPHTRKQRWFQGDTIYRNKFTGNLLSSREGLICGLNCY